MATIPRVQRSECPVPVWWVDGDDDVRGSLLFRVGAADETLVSRGITRLAIEVALMGVPQVERSVVVSAAISSIYVTGSPVEVMSALGTISRSLASPALDHVEAARLAVIEESLWSPIRIENLATSLHFGAQGFGLVGYDNYGVTEVTAEEVEAWLHRYFVVGNAAISINCEPRGLSVVLEPGGPVLTPPPLPLALPRPRWDSNPGSSQTVLSVVGRRDLAGYAALRALAGRCRVTIDRRQHAGYASRYDSVGPYRQWLDGRIEVNAIGYMAGPGESGSAVLAELVEDFASLGPSAHELHNIAATMHAELDDPARAGGLADGAACNALVNVTWPPAHELPDLVRDLDPEDVRQAWCELSANAVWMIPTGEDAPEVCGPPLNQLSYLPQDGRHFAPTGTDGTPGLVTVTNEAITQATSAQGGTAIAFDQVAALVRLDDDSLMIYGTSGDLIFLRPDEWTDGDALAAEVSKRVPEQAQIRSRIPSTDDFDFGPDDQGE